MRTVHTLFDIRALQASWQAFDAMAHLRPIHDEDSYDRIVALMNSLLDTTGEDEDHPLSGLLDLVSDLVSTYEQEHHAIEPEEPKEVHLPPLGHSNHRRRLLAQRKGNL